MDCFRSFTFLLTITIFSINKTSGQTSLNVNHTDSIVALYFQNEVQENTHLYTGKEYIKHPYTIKGHPFFETDQMQNGDIFYDGTLYNNIPLLYDIVRGQVVINRYQQDFRIYLVNEKINFFTFDGHTFENIISTGENVNANSTMYDVIYKGNASVLVKRIKHIKNGLRAEDPAAFIEEDEFYISKGKNVFAVSNKNSVTDALKDKKDQVKTFIKRNRLRFKKNKEKDLTMIAAYYSTLNK